MRIRALGKCHEECRFCAQNFFKWLKGRMTQMAKPRRGDTVSFAEAASSGPPTDQ